MADEAVEADDDDYDSEEDTDAIRAETSDGEGDSVESWYTPIKETKPIAAEVSANDCINKGTRYLNCGN